MLVYSDNYVIILLVYLIKGGSGVAKKKRRHAVGALLCACAMCIVTTVSAFGGEVTTGASPPDGITVTEIRYMQEVSRAQIAYQKETVSPVESVNANINDSGSDEAQKDEGTVNADEREDVRIREGNQSPSPAEDNQSLGYNNQDEGDPLGEFGGGSLDGDNQNENDPGENDEPPSGEEQGGNEYDDLDGGELGNPDDGEPDDGEPDDDPDPPEEQNEGNEWLDRLYKNKAYAGRYIFYYNNTLSFTTTQVYWIERLSHCEACAQTTILNLVSAGTLVVCWDTQEERLVPASASTVNSGNSIAAVGGVYPVVTTFSAAGESHIVYWNVLVSGGTGGGDGGGQTPPGDGDGDDSPSPSPTPPSPNEEWPPGEPQDPGELLSPPKPIESPKPIDPTEPGGPTDPTEPTDPAEPTEPIGPTEPTEPADPTEPAEPTKPVAPPNDNQNTNRPSQGEQQGQSSEPVENKENGQSPPLDTGQDSKPEEVLQKPPEQIKNPEQKNDSSIGVLPGTGYDISARNPEEGSRAFTPFSTAVFAAAGFISAVYAVALIPQFNVIRWYNIKKKGVRPWK